MDHSSWSSRQCCKPANPSTRTLGVEKSLLLQCLDMEFQFTVANVRFHIVSHDATQGVPATSRAWRGFACLQNPGTNVFITSLLWRWGACIDSSKSRGIRRKRKRKWTLSCRAGRPNRAESYGSVFPALSWYRFPSGDGALKGQVQEPAR